MVFDVGKTIFGLIIVSPILLVHGYAEDSSVWNNWEDWLRADNFTVYTMDFKNECGTTIDHVKEIKKTIDKIGEDVDVVAHSKGGIDMRAYISQYPNTVNNLVMMGTPNEGTTAAIMEVTPCWLDGGDGLLDLLPGSNAVKTKDQANTSYWSVVGNNPFPCVFSVDRWMCGVIPNDGFVTVESAESHYMTFQYPYNHNELIQKRNIYEKVLQIIR